MAANHSLSNVSSFVGMPQRPLVSHEHDGYSDPQNKRDSCNPKGLD
ncbi:MAG TPA: hypothetical protein VND65_10995 [Candidatus Binatia bacterium]|nr:hypothetical protein [Candidatus Binatia bacterium]